MARKARNPSGNGLLCHCASLCSGRTTSSAQVSVCRAAEIHSELPASATVIRTGCLRPLGDSLCRASRQNQWRSTTSTDLLAWCDAPRTTSNLWLLPTAFGNTQRFGKALVYLGWEKATNQAFRVIASNVQAGEHISRFISGFEAAQTRFTWLLMNPRLEFATRFEKPSFLRTSIDDNFQDASTNKHVSIEGHNPLPTRIFSWSSNQIKASVVSKPPSLAYSGECYLPTYSTDGQCSR